MNKKIKLCKLICYVWEYVFSLNISSYLLASLFEATVLYLWMIIWLAPYSGSQVKNCPTICVHTVNLTVGSGDHLYNNARQILNQSSTDVEIIWVIHTEKIIKKEVVSFFFFFLKIHALWTKTFCESIKK